MTVVKTFELTKEQIHDLREAIRTMSLALDEIKGGYRFDDESAAQKLVYLERSVSILKTTLGPTLS